MKKLICLVLSVMLVLAALPASAAIEYSLWEKWQRQVDFGNGIKGTLTVDVAGEAEWVKLLAPLSGVPLQIRAIHDGDVFQYRLYAEKGEEMLGLTQLYGDGQAIYLKSDLLPEMLLSLTTGGDVMNRIAGVQEGESPSLYSAVMNIMNVPQTNWEGKWQPALSAYEEAIELWLESYASAPSVKRAEDGSATVLVRYDIPQEALKTQIKALWGNVLADATFLPLLQDQLNQAQQDAYLNPNLKYYYDQVIDALALDGNVVLEREMTAKGEAIRTEMIFPLDVEGWTQLHVKQVDKTTGFDLQGKDKQIVLEMTETDGNADSTAWQGRVRIIPEDKEKKAFAAAFTLVEVKSSSTDEDTRSHDISNWTVDLQPDAEYSGEGWVAFVPTELTARVHLSSKKLQSNAVTFDVDVTAKQAEAEVAVALHLSTRSKYVMDELPTEGAENIATMDEAERTQLFIDLGMNGLTVLQMLNQETVEAAPAETAEIAATEAPAVADDAETTEAPAATMEAVQ